MAKIYKRTMPNGREIMVKFGYADNNGEYYTRFADASYQNGGRGASYAAFVADPADIPCWDCADCWECDESYWFRDRALESWEKKDFVEDYLIRHPSIEAFDFISKVQDELKRRYSADATVRDFDEDCEIAITSERDEQDVSVYISFNEGGIINVMGCYNGYDIFQTNFDWSDAKAVADEAWAAFLGLSNYRDCFHLPSINGESTLHIESMDMLKAEFDEKMYKMLGKSFRNYVEYVRELTDDFTAVKKLPINWGYKQDWRGLWIELNEEVGSKFGASSWMIRAQVWTAIAYYYYESHNGRFMCNDTVVKYMLPEFAVEYSVLYDTTSTCCLANATDVWVYGNMDVVNNPLHSVCQKICKLANEMKGEKDHMGKIVLNWDNFDVDEEMFIKNNEPYYLCSFTYRYSRAFGTYIRSIGVVNDELVVYIR